MLKKWFLFVSLGLCLGLGFSPDETQANYDIAPIIPIDRDRLVDLSEDDLKGKPFRVFRWDQHRHVLIVVFQTRNIMQQTMAVLSLYAWEDIEAHTASNAERTRRIQDLLESRPFFEDYHILAHVLTYQHIIDYHEDLQRAKLTTNNFDSSLENEYENTLFRVLGRKLAIGKRRNGTLGNPANTHIGAVIGYSLDKSVSIPFREYLIDRSMIRAKFFVDLPFKRTLLAYFDRFTNPNIRMFQWILDPFYHMPVDRFINLGQARGHEVTFDPSDTLRVSLDAASHVLASPPALAFSAPWARDLIFHLARKALIEYIFDHTCPDE